LLSKEDKENLKASLQQNPEPAVALSAQKRPLVEQNQNVSHAQKPAELIRAKPARQVRLEQGSLHKFLLKHVDETFVEESFYMTLFDRESDLAALAEALKAAYPSDCVQMATKLTDLKLGDFVEVIFQEHWYRAVIRELTNDQAVVFFLDYGNSEKLTCQDLANKKLRFRRFYRNVEEEKVFGIEYQAIRCVYSCEIKPAVIEFCDRLSEMGVEVLEKGIDLRVKQAEDGGSEGVGYHVVFADEEDKDENKKTDGKLKVKAIIISIQ